MAPSFGRAKRIALILSAIATIPLGGCTTASEMIRDESAGSNGSFESVKNGLPVNWCFYTPRTVGTGDFDIVVDTTEFKDGKQSLKFVVRACSPLGGKFSPGLFREYTASPGETYRVSCWVKNTGSRFVVTIRGVSVSGGVEGTVVKSEERIDAWRLLEHRYTIPPKMIHLRFEVSVLAPGTFWIDDVRIERIHDGE